MTTLAGSAGELDQVCAELLALGSEVRAIEAPGSYQAPHQGLRESAAEADVAAQAIKAGMATFAEACGLAQHHLIEGARLINEWTAGAGEVTAELIRAGNSE